MLSRSKSDIYSYTIDVAPEVTKTKTLSGITHTLRPVSFPPSDPVHTPSNAKSPYYFVVICGIPALMPLKRLCFLFLLLSVSSCLLSSGMGGLIPSLSKTASRCKRVER